MFIHHVSFPVVLPRERFAALPGIRTLGDLAVVLLRSHVLVIDVTIEMRLGAKPHIAVVVWANMRSLMISFVVAGSPG
jgi:hypothetical protein